MKKEKIPNIAGVIFLVFGMIAVLNAVKLGDVPGILWFCYIGLIILGIGFLKKSYFLVESQLNILIIPLTVWAFDFIYFIIFGKSLLNIVGYFFEPGPILGKVITLQHLFTIPLALYSLYFIRPKIKNSWIFSIVQVSILFVITRILTTPERNINWVYHTSLNLTVPYYPLFWFVIIFVMIFLTNFLLRKFQSLNPKPEDRTNPT